MHRARGRELGAAGEGARGEPCGEHKSRQVPAAQRKVVDFILSRVETREGLSGEEQDLSGCCVVKGEAGRGAGVRVLGAAVQVGGGGRFLSSQEGGGSGLALVLDWRLGKPGYPGHGVPSFLPQPDFQTPIPSLSEGQPEQSFLEDDPAVLFGPPEAELMTRVWCWPWGKGKRTQEGLLWGQAPRGHPGLCPAGSHVARGAWHLSSCWLRAAAWSGRGTALGPVGLALLPGRKAGHTSNSAQVASQEFATSSLIHVG